MREELADHSDAVGGVKCFSGTPSASWLIAGLPFLIKISVKGGLIIY